MTETVEKLNISDHYEKFYEDADLSWRNLGARHKSSNIVNLCRDIPHETILEIGSGDGAILERLSELGFGSALYGLEIAAAAVRLTKRRNIARLSECRVYDGYNIPYEDGRFDVVLMSHVLEHVEHPRQLLLEAARVAKFVFVEVPLELNSRLSEDFVFGPTGHLNFFTRKSIRLLLQSSGYQVLRQVVTNPPLAVYLYQRGKLGGVAFAIKDIALRLFPHWATARWTYNSACLCLPCGEDAVDG